jgi:hypothetical protein
MPLATRAARAGREVQAGATALCIDHDDESFPALEREAAILILEDLGSPGL